MLKLISNWYEGKTVLVNPDEPETIGGMGVLRETKTDFHWTAKLTRKFIEFVKNKPGQAILLICAVVSAIVGIDKLLK